MHSMVENVSARGGVVDLDKEGLGQMSREEWLAWFEERSIAEITVLFSSLSEYLLSDDFKRRSCGIAPETSGSAEIGQPRI